MLSIRSWSIFAALVLLAPAGFAAETAAEEPPREATHTVTRSEAVKALRNYQQDPVNNLESASVFMTYVKEDGDVHVSMNDILLPWMRGNYPPQTKAALLSAFVAGNFQSQLNDETELDDSVAGLIYVVDVYAQLKKQDAALLIPELEKLLTAKGDDELEVAINRMIAR